MPQQQVIDYDTFLPRLVAGLRKAFEDVRSKRPDESFYLFGIETDSDITDLYPLSKSEKQGARNKYAKNPIMRWEIDSEKTRRGSKHTEALAKEVNRYVFEDHRGDPEDAFEERKAKLLEIFEQALVQLDQDGLFGKGKARHKVLLKIDICDASVDEWNYILEVIERINPPESTAEFFAAVRAVEKEKADREKEKQPIKDMAIALLHRKKQPIAECVDATRVRNEGVIPYLLKLLPVEPKPTDLWEVMFYIEDLPPEKHDSSSVLVVVVDPATGNCAIEPRL